MLNKIIYGLIVYPVSRMPFPLLYVFSDFLFFVMFRLVGYRRKVVFDNLKNSFPEKEEKELNEIEKKFFKHFCDLIVESIKGFTISEEEVLKRMTYSNKEVLENLAKKNKSVTFIGGHFGNWELLAVTIAQTIPHTVKALYTPLKGKYWDDKITASRSRFGLKMFTIQNVKVLRDSLKGELSAVIFGSDQSPSNPKRAYWLKFLNQDTGVQFGAEKHAKDFDTAVIYGAITKNKRGYYNTEFIQLFENVGDLEYGAVIESFSKTLEEKIRENPHYYLWTHRRWKHKLPEGMSLGQRM
jgi:KDO2-lipid IV(A) lauroyltransferase